MKNKTFKCIQINLISFANNACTDERTPNLEFLTNTPNMKQPSYNDTLALRRLQMNVLISIVTIRKITSMRSATKDICSQVNLHSRKPVVKADITQPPTEENPMKSWAT